MLTDDEIYTMYSEPSSDAEMVAFARAVEAAVIAKLAAAEMPERFGFLGESIYTEAQLREYGAACAARQLSAEPVVWTTKGQIAAMESGFNHYIQGRVPRFVRPCDDDVPLFTRSTT